MTSAPCYDREAVDGILNLCARLPGQTFQSPYRSAVPLLALFQDAIAWQALLDALGVAADSRSHFEYCVPSPKPGANPSQTDLLITAGNGTWAVEAKWTEPRYEAVTARLARREADGSDPSVTVSGWLTPIQAFSPRRLELSECGNVVYQTLHRAASACAVAAERATPAEMVYLHFHPSPLPSSATKTQYLADLSHLREILGTESRLRLTLVEVLLAPTSAFDRIKALDKRAKQSAAPVRKALCEERLFEFGVPEVMRVQAA